MSRLTLDDILLFYDYPQVFRGRDAFASLFVCMAVDE